MELYGIRGLSTEAVELARGKEGIQAKVRHTRPFWILIRGLLKSL
jgi:hypothetical protein